jgi:hypothetical protein
VRAKHSFGATIMEALLETKFTLAARSLDRPAGKTAGDFLDIFLCITAVHPKRVQFHDLAGIVFVDTSAAVIRSPLSRRTLRTNAHPIVQVKKHRRALCRCS